VAIPTPARKAVRDYDIEVLDDVFSPGELSVPVGTTLVWRNVGQRMHDIQSLNGAWHTLAMEPGQSARVTFNTPGTYGYVCTLHASMQGRVIVSS
jgi:plastocyanin